MQINGLLIDGLLAEIAKGYDPAADILVLSGLLAAGVAGVEYDPQKTLILFTSDRRAEADDVQRSRPDCYAVIHETPTGAGLDQLQIFKYINGETGYLDWNLVAAALIMVNKPQKALLIASPQNETSTLWNLELPLLRKVSPQCEVVNFDTGKTMPESELDALCKPHLQDYLERLGTDGVYAKRWGQAGRPNVMEEAEAVRARLLLIHPLKNALAAA